MANNRTQTSFYFRCGNSVVAKTVADWINGGGAYPYPDDLRESMTKAVAETFDDGVLDVTIADATADNDQVWIFLDEGGDLELLALILAYAMDRYPEVENRQGFQWAETCDQPRVDEFGGGAVFIARGQKPEWFLTAEWLARKVEGKAAFVCA